MIQHKTVSFSFKDLEMVLEATIDTKKNDSGLSFKIKPTVPKQGRKSSETFTIDPEDALALMEWLRDEVLGLNKGEQGPKGKEITAKDFKEVPEVKQSGLTSQQVRERRAKSMGIVDMSKRIANPQTVKVKQTENE